MKNLARAVREFDRVRAWDTTVRWQGGRLVLDATRGDITKLGPHVPGWLHEALRGTEYASRLPSE